MTGDALRERLRSRNADTSLLNTSQSSNRSAFEDKMSPVCKMRHVNNNQRIETLRVATLETRIKWHVCLLTVFSIDHFVLNSFATSTILLFGYFPHTINSTISFLISLIMIPSFAFEIKFPNFLRNLFQSTTQFKPVSLVSPSPSANESYLQMDTSTLSNDLSWVDAHRFGTPTFKSSQVLQQSPSPTKSPQFVHANTSVSDTSGILEDNKGGWKTPAAYGKTTEKDDEDELSRLHKIMNAAKNTPEGKTGILKRSNSVDRAGIRSRRRSHGSPERTSVSENETRYRTGELLTEEQQKRAEFKYVTGKKFLSLYGKYLHTRGYARMSEDHHDEKQFKSAESGAAATFPKQCSALREDGYVMIRGRACKIENLNVSTARMHEDVPIVHLVGIDIFTSKKLEDICPSTHNMDVPVVKRREYILLSIEEDGFCSLMDPESCDLKDDLKMPDGEMGNSIREAFDKDDGSVSVQVVAACGEEAVVNFDLRPIELKKELVERRRVLKSHPTILAALCNNETKPTSAEQGHPIASTPTNAVLKVIHSFLNVFLDGGGNGEMTLREFRSILETSYHGKFD